MKLMKKLVIAVAAWLVFDTCVAGIIVKWAMIKRSDLSYLESVVAVVSALTDFAEKGGEN